jgi:glycosyltransferase involved in cell wall biosynthesis
MYHADLLGGLAARWSRLPVVWNVQGSNLDARTTRRRTRAIVAGCARLSRVVPARIVICGPATARVHVALGYAEDRVVVIPNAVDTAVFKPDPEARGRVRRELGLPDDAVLVGVAARFDPQKDHRTLLDAWARLRRRGAAPAHLLLFGSGVTATNPLLYTWMREFGGPDVHLLGPRTDVARIFAACDVSCLSSAYGEGLPNAVAEAMACGLPCVVTDVGDSAWVVGSTGVVVPPRDPERLSAGLEALVSTGRERLQTAGVDARRRVEEHFELGDAAARYHALYDEVCADA